MTETIDLARGFDLLDDAAVETVHERSLAILERVGVALRSEPLLRRLADAGARVDLGLLGSHGLILLTGATGYVDGRLLTELVHAGYRVRCLARRPENLRPRVTAWLNNKLVEESTYRLMTDSPKQWLGWLLNDYFAQRTFNRSLSVCCGDGAHEIQLYTSGKVRFVSGVDISEGAIKQANGRFEAVDAPPDRYRFVVRDVNALTIDGTFDLILSTGALHHTTNLEALLATVERALEPNGYFIVVEFIGPNRFQWTDRQVEIANQVLGVLDPYYLRER